MRSDCGAKSGFGMYFSENTATSQDPKLVVTYTLPITFIPQIISLF